MANGVSPPSKPYIAPASNLAVGRPTKFDCSLNDRELRKLPRPPAPVYGPALRRFEGGGWFSHRPGLDSQVVAYTHGECCFADIADAILTAREEEHRIYIAGWWIATDTWLLPRPVPPAASMHTLEQFMKATKAQIRSLTWKPPVVRKPIPDNGPWVSFVNSLPNGAAIADDKLPEARSDNTAFCRGIHHQKLLVVYGSKGLIAFLGGMDLNNTRISNQGPEPLHDVHLRITGRAARDVLQTFRDRW